MAPMSTRTTTLNSFLRKTDKPLALNMVVKESPIVPSPVRKTCGHKSSYWNFSPTNHQNEQYCHSENEFTQTIATKWIQILHSKIGRINKAEPAQMLQKQKDKFWNINTKNQSQTYLIKDNFRRVSTSQYQSTGDNNSDPGMSAYDGSQDSVINTAQKKSLTNTKHKQKSHKLKLGIISKTTNSKNINAEQCFLWK